MHLKNTLAAILDIEISVPIQFAYSMGARKAMCVSNQDRVLMMMVEIVEHVVATTLRQRHGHRWSQYDLRVFLFLSAPDKSNPGRIGFSLPAVVELTRSRSFGVVAYSTIFRVVMKRSD